MGQDCNGLHRVALYDDYCSDFINCDNTITPWLCERCQIAGPFVVATSNKMARSAAYPYVPLCTAMFHYVAPVSNFLPTTAMLLFSFQQ
jgi:hypothetical protein